ncbi:MAG: class I SAM-dependent methyltransferase, partial [Rhodospirillales bacterium]|nr:class I SAM-dependent methyltransferase [Rhodospirillales bacterium]
WEARFSEADPDGRLRPSPAVRFHRKNWEWLAIAQALSERGMLERGRRGCGFAVGMEPLASLFAASGAEVLATDLGAADEAAKAWTTTGQHAATLEALYWPGFVSRAEFDARVRFMPQDMRALEPDRLGHFDFIWSSCSFEHLGSLEAGLQFVLRSTELLKPGGFAVHTTELNLSSDDATVETGDSVIYRRRDLAALAHRLRLIGCAMAPLEDFAGIDDEDIEYDYEPYYGNGREHIKMMLGGFVTTSCLLIIRKGRFPAVLSPAAMSEPVLMPEAGPAGSGPHDAARLRAEIAALKASCSWRVTAPLRALARRLR